MQKRIQICFAGGVPVSERKTILTAFFTAAAERKIAFAEAAPPNLNRHADKHFGIALIRVELDSLSGGDQTAFVEEILKSVCARPVTRSKRAEELAYEIA